nr:hypothetical protein [Tanacetum cinerariifolium]
MVDVNLNVNALAEQAPAMPWRALTTIINLCLKGKTSRFERPRAPVLQILRGIVNLAHIDYAERMWEEFTQSIHSFVKDKKNLSLHTHGKKKANPIEKKRKLVTETYNKPSPAKSSKPGLVTKRRKPTGSLSLVDEFVDEGIPEKEPRFDDEEADMQRAVEESLKSVYDAHRGPLPPVVIREPDSRKFQPLPEVQGKRKEKVSDEQVSLDLLTLQTPTKVSPAEQHIFQRRTPAPTEPSGHALSPSIYAKLGLTDSDTESDEEVPPVVKIGAQDEGQAGPNPGVLIEGQTGSNLSDDAEPQPQSSPVVHAGPNLEHMDLEATDVILEEPASSTGTLSSLQHLAKDFIFGDQFFNDKPSEAENEKTTAETKAESMVSVTIQQDMSTIPPMTTPVIDLTSRPDSPNIHRPLQATATETTTTTTTTHPPPPQPQ